MTEIISGAAFPRIADIENSRLITRPAEAEKETGSEFSFSELLFDALEDVNAKQHEANDLKDGLITGDLDELHDLMIMTEEAKLSLQLTVQTTTKVIEAYQELYRMQI